MKTLRSLIRGLSDYGDKPAIIAVRDDSPNILSHAELVDKVTRLAAGLVGLGVTHGESVAVLAPNLPASIICILSITAAGAVAVPLDTQLADAELARILVDSGCHRIFTTQAHVSRVRALEGPRDLELILLDENEESDERVRGWHCLLTGAAGDVPAIVPEDTAALIYTSGTTGPPKGVPLTHRNILANVDALLEERLAGPGDRVLLPLPLHHVYPLVVGMLAPLASGAAIVLPSGISGPEIIRALRLGRVTVMIGVPRLYAALVCGIKAKVSARGNIAARTFAVLLRSSIWLRRRCGLRVGRILFRTLHAEVGHDLRLLSSGGAHLDPDLAWMLEGLGWVVLTGYGLTETSPILTSNPRDRRRIGTVGVPVRGVELRIQPRDGAALGEVLVRGANVFSGYRDNPQATKAAFTSDGWFRTGDLGFVDTGGYLHIVGRADEMIVLADGKNVFPEGVEAVYAESPFIREVAVLERNGALVALVAADIDAFRARGAGRMEDFLREIMRNLSLRLPAYERVSGYAVTREALPRTRLGKFRRHLLPALYDRAQEGAAPPQPKALSDADRALLESPTGKRVWKWLLARYPDKVLTPDTSPQLDLGVDSLEWVTLTLEMQERIGVTLADEAIARVVTLRDLLAEAVAVEVAVGEMPTEHVPESTAPDLERWLKPPGALLSSVGLILYGINRLIFRSLFHLRREGIERLPQSGPFVLAPNHASFLDGFAVGAALPWRQARRIYWAGATERLFATPLQRLFSRAAHAFPVDPDRAAVSSLAFGSAVLAREKALVWFPEGRRSPNGRLQWFMPGIGVLLARSGVPVVPVHIGGAFEALPLGRRLPRFRPIVVVFGDPLDPAELESRGAGDSVHARIADALHEAAAAMFRPESKGTAAAGIGARRAG